LIGEFWDDIHIDRERALRRLDEVTNKAVNLDRAHAVTWKQRAMVLLYTGQWEASLEASAKAMRLDPTIAGLFTNARGN
jgi:Tfp pilus assembly protein PilF